MVLFDELVKEALKGGGEARLMLLREFANQMAVLPVVSYSSESDGPERKKISVATTMIAGRRQVPVFTSEDCFFAWTDGTHQCFSLLGADIAMTLPPESYLLINPGQRYSIELTPDEVRQVADNNFPVIETKVASALNVEDDSAAVNEEPVENNIIEIKQTERESLSIPGREEVISALNKLFEEFKSISEAYFVETGGRYNGPVLGLLTKNLNTEGRFLIIEKIADLSRRLYHEAGAIEVYDDLHSASSSSWELFNAEEPIYTLSSKVPASLSESIERKQVLAANQPPVSHAVTPPKKSDKPKNIPKFRF